MWYVKLPVLFKRLNCRILKSFSQQTHPSLHVLRLLMLWRQSQKLWFFIGTFWGKWYNKTLSLRQPASHSGSDISEKKSYSKVRTSSVTNFRSFPLSMLYNLHISVSKYPLHFPMSTKVKITWQTIHAFMSASIQVRVL